MAGELILLVDDEPSIIQLAQMYLEKEGFQVASVGDGNDAISAAREMKPDLIVLDVMLPGVDGFEVCRKLRAEDNPVLIVMLTARDEDIDKIVGLELGADDYMTKPFNPRELVARVKAMLRRVSRPAPAVDGGVVRLSNLTIDPARREVRVDGELIELRTQEFDLMLVLAENKSIVLTREKLLNMAWGYDYFGQTRTVDVHIAHLRKKLAQSTVKIETVTGVGYKLVVA